MTDEPRQKTKPKPLRPGKPATDLIPPERHDAGAKVAVACKLPMGLRLHVSHMEDYDEPVVGGGIRTKQRAVKHGAEHVIYGPAYPFGMMPNYRIVGGYAITENIPADFWDEWMAINHESDLVKNKIVFAFEDVSYAADAAKEHKAVLSGLQPLDMSMIQRGTQMVAVDQRLPRPLPGIPNGVEPLDKVA